MTQSPRRLMMKRALRRAAPMLACAALLATLGMRMAQPAAEEARAIPAPALEEATPPASSEVAVLAGGCFWGVQGVFQHTKGVENAVSGYTGGKAADAEYEKVGGGWTGHAESVQITFDPRQISYGRLLQIYFSVAHNPTELNRQGPDSGPQYRSAVFPMSAEQARVAKAYITQLDEAHVFGAAIVTKIEPGKTFYPAEGYHQDFLAHNPTYPYIVINDLPKIEDLKRLYPDAYRADPVLVAGARSSN
jgi:peptide-methionine (S)-S-oxide reductase